MRDVRMIELGQDLTLDFESGLNALRAPVNHFDGYLLLEFGVRPLGEENLPHPADTQGAQYAIWPYSVSFHRRKHAPPCGRIAITGGSCSGAILACMKPRPFHKQGVGFTCQMDTTLTSRSQ